MPEVKITQEQLVNWTVQLTKGLKFIHKMDFIHRDIKPSKYDANERLIDCLASY